MTGKPSAPEPNPGDDLHSTTVQSVHMSEFPIESSAQLQNAKDLVKKAQNMAKQGKTAAQDLDTSTMSVATRYRHENQNSIYFLRPNAMEIFFLDFKRKGFVKEDLRWSRGNRGQIPAQITTVQSSDASIYVIGGCRQ